MDSILNSIKKKLGIEPSYKHFDEELIITINSVFGIIHQLGVGPQDKPFRIDDDVSTWDDFMVDDQIETIKDYIFLKTKLIFDPPANSFTVTAYEKLCAEFEWRCNVNAETP